MRAWLVYVWVQEVLGKPHAAKRAAKKALLDEVKTWCDENSKEAMTQFEKSAADVVEKLKDIRQSLFA